MWRNMNTCSQIALSRRFFNFIAATDTDVPIEILVPVFTNGEGGSKVGQKASEGIVMSKFTLRSN